jgi:hypothetical protein
MHRKLSIPIAPVLVVITAVAVACSSSTSTGLKLTTQQLAGSYYLDTISNGAVTASFPAVVGTLVLTETTFFESVSIVEAPGDTVVVSAPDSGTYTISGSTLTETSVNSAIPAVTATASLRGGDTLDVTVTSPAQAAGTYVWVRTN